MGDHSTLDKIFDIDPNTVVIEAGTTTLIPVNPAPSALAANTSVDETNIAQLDSDVQYAREVMRDSIEHVREAMKSAILLAQSGDSPRAFEVVGNMLSSIVNANKELAVLHKTREETIASQKARVQGSEKTGDVHIEKAVFIGRAADLLRELRQTQKSEQVIDIKKDDTE